MSHPKEFRVSRLYRTRWLEHRGGSTSQDKNRLESADNNSGNITFQPLKLKVELNYLRNENDIYLDNLKRTQIESERLRNDINILHQVQSSQLNKNVQLNNELKLEIENYKIKYIIMIY